MEEGVEWAHDFAGPPAHDRQGRRGGVSGEPALDLQEGERDGGEDDVRGGSCKKLRDCGIRTGRSPSNPLISLKLNRRLRSEKCWLGVRDDFRIWLIRDAA